MPKDMQKSDDEIKKVLSLAGHLRTKAIIPSLEVQNLLNFQYSQITKKSGLNFCNIEKVSVNKAFKRAFKTLSRTQQADYYLKCVKIILKEICSTSAKFDKIEELESQKNKIDQQNSEQFEQITVLIKKQGSFTNWVISKIQLASEISVLRIIQSGEQLDLHHYILRQSNSKNKLSLVLESIDQLARPTTFRITNYKQTFEELKAKVEVYLERGLKQKIIYLLKKGRGSFSSSFRSSLQAQILMPMRQKKLKSSQLVDVQTQSLPATLRFIQGKNPKSMKKIIRDCSKLTLLPHQAKKIYTKLITHEKIFALGSFKDFDKISEGVFHNKKTHVTRRIFLFQETQMGYEWLVTSMNCYKIFKKWKSCLFLINLLAQFPQEMTKIYHQINLYKDYNEVDYIFLRHLFEIDGVNYFIDKSVNTEQYGRVANSSRGWIEECVWRFRKIDGIIEVLVQIQFGGNFNKKNSLQMAIEYIGEIDELKKEYQQKQKLNQSTFKTVYNQNLFLFEDESEFNGENSELNNLSNNQKLKKVENKHEKIVETPSFLEEKSLSLKEQFLEQHNLSEFMETQFYSIDGSQNQQESDIEIDASFEEETEEQNKVQNNASVSARMTFSRASQPIKKQSLLNPSKYPEKLKYLFVHHQVQCLPKNPKNQVKQSTEQNGHFLWRKQWKITQKGELININEEQIKVQSSVLKLVVKRMGRNILAGKSVLNISLPIEIFGTDSNLQRLCKSMAYGPRFLQKAATLQSPVQRMKHVICFALGYSICYIEMQKPFNPILGQTYQGMIDGCPVYGQQTSHHPPISTVLFKGRGYSVYGNLQAKVDMGLNSASGINDGLINVSFHPDNYNENLVRFTCPPGEISGLVMGDRKLSLIKKTFYFDQKNNILAFIQWGSQKKKNQISFNNDYFQGQIVQLKPNTDVSKLDKIKQAHCEKILCQIKGRWTGEVSFNDVVLFDVRKDGFYNVEEEKFPLESNVLYREDIILRKQNDLNMAQQAKEKLQQIQREDRKLRKKYEKQN